MAEEGKLAVRAAGQLKRRGLMAGAAALVGAAVAKLAGPDRVAQAANGDPLLVGVATNTATANTLLNVTGGSIALDVRTTDSVGVSGLSSTNVGVQGASTGNAGVRGTSTNNFGVFGENSSIGVVGTGGNGGVVGVCAPNPAVTGRSGGNIGVIGEGAVAGGGFTGGAGISAIATSANGVGVQANSAFVAVQATASGSGIGLLAQSSSGPAGRFQGAVEVQGNFSATGIKSAVVPGPDGNLLRYYCTESPEAFFEDLGIAQLENGRATVRLDSKFVFTVESDRYHISVTPLGPSNGLHVSAIGREGFDVTENGDAPSANIAFSWRAVAKRKDIASPRFQTVEKPPTLNIKTIDPRTYIPEIVKRIGS